MQSLLQKLSNSLANHTFVKLTLSKPTLAAGDLRNVYARLVDIKNQPHLSFTLRYPTRDETKNFLPQDGLSEIAHWLGKYFLNADLFTLQEDITLMLNKKGKATLLIKKPSHPAPADTQHNKEKKRPLRSTEGHYLYALGITNAEGEVLPTGQKKYKQISRYIELISDLLKEHPLPPDARIVDMGAGKGYLTFALYDYLTQFAGYAPRFTGIELRQHLVDFCNELSKKSGFATLDFQAEDINTFETGRLDMLIALHACDTATDLAIAKGIRAGASIIVVAPCCHKQIRRDMDCHNELAPILKYGILEERQAELLTDGIRALLMEAHGYRTKVFEFISTQHTPKNLMIAGIKGKPRPEALDQVAAIKQSFGIRSHFLEELLT